MPHRGMLVDDKEWIEVRIANNYALFMGYLSMAVKGLGFLVLTWTTVVFLGGFVSTLQKKDFWCLTFMTLVQTAGIFDVLLTEKLSYIGDSFLGVMAAGYAVLSSNPLQLKSQWLATAIGVVQVLVFAILLCPLVAVYMFGLYISAAISVWRLSQHDYGNDADGHGNLKPALNVLYSLALLQGVMFSYKVIFGFAKGTVVNGLLCGRSFGDRYRAGISDYLLETMTGCEKDPLSARGRNLITYGVDLMGSKSTDDYLSGVRILDAFAKQMETIGRVWEEERSIYVPQAVKAFMHEHILLKHLVMSASSTDILKKLLQTLGLRNIYNRDEGMCRKDSIICQVLALQILENLFSHYTGDDESLKAIKQVMANAVPEMLVETLCLVTEETHTGPEVDQDRFMKPETNAENQGGDSQDNGQGNNSSSNQQQDCNSNKYGVVHKLSFCVTVWDTLISADQDLAHQIDAIAPKDGAFSFPRKLKEFVKIYMHPRANCLEIVKLTCKIVISMMKHRGTYIKEDMESLMDTLSTASKEMFIIDGSMVFDVNQNDTTALKSFRSLASLMKEAQELVDKRYGLSS